MKKVGNFKSVTLSLTCLISAIMYYCSDGHKVNAETINDVIDASEYSYQLNAMQYKLRLDTYIELHNERMKVVEADRLERERIAREKAIAEEKKRQEELERQRLIKQKQIEQERQKRLKEQQSNASTEGDWQMYQLTFYNLDYQSTGKSPSHPAFGITASGVKATVGVTVACPKHIPFGTKVYIEGFGERKCEDRGGKIRNNLLDVLVSSRAEAYRLGRINARVKFY